MVEEIIECLSKVNDLNYLSDSSDINNNNEEYASRYLAQSNLFSKF